jgi:hypothetical protein
MSEATDIAENGNWDDDFGNEKQTTTTTDQKRVPWMKFDQPGEYQIRLCGNYVKFHRWWSPFTTRLITHLSYKNEDPAWNAGFWPRKTFAIHVIDRNDTDEEHPTGKLKILEKGSSIFEVFADYKRINKINPAGQKGPDFVVTVKWPGGKKRNADYSVTPMAAINEWTPEEVAMIKEEHAELKKIYAPSALEKIKEEWAKLPEDAKIPPERDDKGYTKQATAQAPAPATPAPAPIQEAPALATADDDLFGDDNAETAPF